MLEIVHDDPPYEDTTALYQAEIERLEAELAARDAAAATQGPGADHESARRVHELTIELAIRDETIAQLWDHLREREEAEAAAEADWDDVQRLIEELEGRLGASGSSSPDGDRARWVEERRAWDDQRAYLESEIAELRARLRHSVQAARAGDSNTTSRITELEAENQRLHEACRRLPQLEATAKEVEDLRRRVPAAETAGMDLSQSWSRRNGNAATSGSRSSKSASRLSAADLTPDERIRALRQHLREVHEREQEERKNGQLKARLVRLWKSMSN